MSSRPRRVRRGSTLPFRYHGYTIRVLPCPERRDCFLADVTSPDGYEYGPMGLSETWLEAKHSGKKFVRDIRAIVAGMSRGMREITFSTSTCLEC